MTDALSYIIDKWDLNIKQPSPIQIPNTTRHDLASLFYELGYREGAEIGTLGGAYANKLKLSNPELILYCIDPWEKYDGMQFFDAKEYLTERYHLAVRKMKNYKDVHFIKKLSMDAVKDFEDNSLDFVFIDANHELPYITEDIFYWSKKIRPGGIVSGHDYKITRDQPKDWHNDIRGAVLGYTDAYNIKPFFVMDECTNERIGSFLWVKE